MGCFKVSYNVADFEKYPGPLVFTNKTDEISEWRVEERGPGGICKVTIPYQ